MRRNEPLDIGERQQVSGRGVGVGDDDAAVFPGVIADTYRKVVVERNGDAVDSVQSAING